MGMIEMMKISYTKRSNVRLGEIVMQYEVG